MRISRAAIFILTTATVYGCTICHTARGSAVRAGIFNDLFPITFLEVVAPFFVLGLVLYVVDRCIPD